MTVENTNNTISYTGNGSVDTFAYNFLTYSADHLFIYFDAVLQSSGFTITGVGDDNGGNVVFSSPPDSGVTIRIDRTVPDTQLLEYQEYGPFPAKANERGLDLVTMAVQQNARDIGRGYDRLNEAKMDKQPLAIEANIVVFDSEGNAKDSGVNIDNSGVITDLNKVIPFNTLDEAVNETSPLKIFNGAALNLKERSTGNGGGSMWDVVLTSSVVPNGFDVVQSAVMPTLSLKLRVNKIAADLDSFGVVGDCTDNGVGTDNTENIRAAMEYGRINAPVNFVAKGRAYKTRDFKIPVGVTIEGNGLGSWDLPSHGYDREFDGGTTFVIFGSCDNPIQVRGITDMSVCGGEVANPDTETVNDASYKLLNLMNSDATSNEAATPKNLKVGVLIEDQNYGAALRNIRVMLNNDGIDGYNDSLSTSLGDDWDIGILSINSKFTDNYRVQCVGYWRMAAMMQVSTSNGSVPRNGAIFNSHRACYYMGYKGLSVRGNDVYRITALTSTTVEIPWTSSNPFEHSGGAFVLGGKEVVYSSITVAGDKLTFSGLDTDPTTVTSLGNELAYGANIGIPSFNVDEQTCITDLQHTSRVAAHYLGFSAPSEALEVSGFPIRDIEIQAHIFSTDVVAHLHDCQHIDLPNSFVEATGWKKSSVGAFEPQGARFICSIGLDGNYPAGKTDSLNYPHSAEWNAFVDFAPMERSASSGRYTSDKSTGLFKPSLVRFLPKGPYTSDLPLRAYNGYNTLATKNGGLRVVKDSPFVPFAEFNDSIGELYLSPKGFGGLQIDQQNSGQDPRVRLTTQTNSTVVDLLIDDSSGQEAQLRRNGQVILSLTVASITTVTTLPEGLVSAPVGSIALNINGGTGSTFFVKESGGDGNTGWAAK